MATSEHLPSLQTLLAGDDRLLSNELRLAAARRQVAVVRSLADELERCVQRGGDAASLHEQVVQELARLGCRSLEAAVAMCAKPIEDAERSGIPLVRDGQP